MVIVAARAMYNKRNELYDLALDLVPISKKFVADRVVVPISDMYETIRYDKGL